MCCLTPKRLSLSRRLISVFQQLKGTYRRWWYFIHKDACWQDKQQKLLREKFGLDIRGEKTFIGRTIKHWNRLLREMVESPSLEIFKTQLDKALHNLSRCTAFNRRLDHMVSSVSFQPRRCCDSNILS